MSDEEIIAPPPAAVETPAPVAVETPAPASTPALEPPANPPWHIRRIGELTAQKNAAAERAAAVEARAAALEAEIATLRAGQQPAGPATTQPGQPHPVAQPRLTEADIEQRARAIAEESIQTADANVSYNAGVAKYPDFDARIKSFQMIGGLQPEQIQAALATGAAHDVLYTLAGNLDEAARILSLPPLQTAVEMAKIAAKQPAVARASAAPPPVTPIGSGGTRLPDGLADELPDAEWFKRRQEQVKAKRRA